jgi:hypothetical protein
MQKIPIVGLGGPWSDGSLQGIKIHFREFLYGFALKRDKLLAQKEELFPCFLESRRFQNVGF